MASSDVRIATDRDVPRILLLLRNFHAAGNFDFPFQAARMAAFIRNSMESADSATFVLGAPVCGVLVATKVDSPIAPYAVAMERLLWVEPSARGPAWSNLIDAFEAWARETQCQQTMLFSQIALRGVAVSRLFRRRGYEPLETAHLKLL